eukprot:3198025-Rhodomonas_salina.1
MTVAESHEKDDGSRRNQVKSIEIKRKSTKVDEHESQGGSQGGSQAARAVRRRRQLSALSSTCCTCKRYYSQRIATRGSEWY